MTIQRTMLTGRIAFMLLLACIFVKAVLLPPAMVDKTPPNLTMGIDYNKAGIKISQLVTFTEKNETTELNNSTITTDKVIAAIEALMVQPDIPKEVAEVHEINPENPPAKKEQIPIIGPIIEQIACAVRPSSKNTTIEIQTDLKSVETLLRKAIIDTYIVNGKVHGLKLTGINQISLADKLGLKNGDIISTLNNEKLTGIGHAANVFKRVNSRSSMNIELIRDGKTQKIKYILE